MTKTNASYPNFFNHCATILTLSFLSACVTVNVHLPESAVQKASDDYVKEIYLQKEKGKQATAEPTPKAVSSKSEEEELVSLNFSKAKKIKESLKSRSAEVIREKSLGFLGESFDGKLVLKAPNTTDAAKLKKLEMLVKEENKDRSDLLEAILKENSISRSNLSLMEESFGKSFQEKSPKGTWIEKVEGKWTQK